MGGKQRAPFRVAVIGGGIGGLFAALSLHYHCAEQGIEIDVYEQAFEYKEIGAGVGIGVNAARLLHRLGLGDAANEIAGYRNGVWISFRRSDTGEEIVTVPVNDKEKIRQLPMHRAEFLDLLLGAVRERKAARLHTNKRCRRLIDIGDHIRIEFADETTATAHFVVGADGIHSSVRSQFAFDNPKYSGKIAYRALVPIDKIQSWWSLPTYSASWLGKGRHLLVFPISRNKLLNVVAFVATDETELGDLKESWTAVGDREEALKAYAHFEPAVRRIIELMPETPSKWLLNDREPLEQWVYMNGKVALLGDAAHAMLPHQGAGAGQAMEDGYILGRAIQDYLRTSPADLGSWMHVYQSMRLPRAQKAQRTSRQAGEVYALQAEGLKDKTFEECIPELRNRLKDRMKWVWTEDIDAAYDENAGKTKGDLVEPENRDISRPSATVESVR